MMKEIIELIEKLEDPKIIKSDVITWGSPVISFGNHRNSKIATLGINPSNKEFVDSDGYELDGEKRRFHTLNSLGIENWSQVNSNHLSKIESSFKEYFTRNPYDNWFKKLDYLISGSSFSYYFPSREACHLDIIPFATSCKWSELTAIQKSSLLNISINLLGKIIKRSSIKILILNGQTVVDNLQRCTNSNFNKNLQEQWTLNRKNSSGVNGYSYEGRIDEIGDIKLNREIKILGFNHNIQSSFGVSFKVQKSIRKWITSEINTYFHESR